MMPEHVCCTYFTLKLVNHQAVSPGDKGKEAEPAKAAGPVGGVKPGLDQDEDQPLQGPEPLMGVQHLGQVEKGELTSGDEAVLSAASQITCAHTSSCCNWTFSSMSLCQRQGRESLFAYVWLSCLHQHALRINVLQIYVGCVSKAAQSQMLVLSAHLKWIYSVLCVSNLRLCPTQHDSRNSAG